MSAAVQAVVANQSAAPLGICTIAGRISVKSKRITTQDGTRYLTVVRLPAVDEFSNPSTVEVRSHEPLGVSGDPVRVKVQIGGYGRKYDATDKETGELTKVQTATNTLDVIA